MRIHVLLTAVAVALLGFAPAPLPKRDRQREDLTDVGGTWEFIECQMSGSAYESTRTNYNSEMTREQFSFVGKNGGSRTTYLMKLDPTASPPAFTWAMNNNVMYVGSYRLKNGEMTMIFTGGNRVDQRPVDFGGKPTWRYVLRRIKR